MSEFKKKCLISVQGPTEFLAGYIAYRWCEEKIWFEKSKVTLLIYDTCVPLENEIVFQNTIREIASTYRFHKIFFMSQLESNKISKNHYSKSISELKRLIDEENFDYLFLSRDFGGFMTKLIPNAYPKALKIEYGDSFGLVGNKKEVEGTHIESLRKPLRFLKSKIKKIIYSHYHKSYPFDLTVLTMPLVWDVNYLNDKTLVIPDQLFVKEFVLKIASKLTKLHNYCEELLANPDNNSKLYLLSNLSNSGVCTFENEVSLYEEIIVQTASAGQRIILKNHPRGSDLMLIQLKEKLNSLFVLEFITDERFSFIPIELWDVILDNSEVYPIFSTSAISLKYLYSKQVMLTLDDEKIKKYIYFDQRPEINQGVNMIDEAIKTLVDWDSNSPLWTKA
jgi:hypothetical protein